MAWPRSRGPRSPFVTAWPRLLLLRVLDRLGKGLRSSPRDALLAHAVPAAQRGLAFGLHRAFDNAGAVVGPLLAAGLLALHVPIRDILLWAALPGVLCVALALAMREPVDVDVAHERRPEWAWRTLPPAFRRMLVALALFTLGQASNAFILLRANELGMAADAGGAAVGGRVAPLRRCCRCRCRHGRIASGACRCWSAAGALHALLFVALALVESRHCCGHRGAARASTWRRPKARSAR